MPPAAPARVPAPRVGQPDDAIRALDQLGPMRDDEHRASGAQALDGRRHERDALGVEVGGRLVEDHERRVAQEGACEPDAAALARGRACARRRRSRVS